VNRLNYKFKTRNLNSNHKVSHNHHGKSKTISIYWILYAGRFNFKGVNSNRKVSNILCGNSKIIMVLRKQPNIVVVVYWQTVNWRLEPVCESVELQIQNSELEFESQSKKCRCNSRCQSDRCREQLAVQCFVHQVIGTRGRASAVSR